MLLVRSDEINSPYSGLTVYIYDNGRVIFHIRKDKEFRIHGALNNPTAKITRHLVYSRTGSTLVAVIDGETYQRTITKEVSDVDDLREAPLRFRGNHEHSYFQSLYMDVSNIIVKSKEVSLLVCCDRCI